MRRKLYTTATAVALSIAATLTMGTPANASVSSGYISGSGSLLDDLNDEGPIRYGDHSAAVAVWQKILWADGYLGFAHDAAVDCSFGAKTLEATKKWQRDHNLVDDGVPGNKTFAKAGKFLKAAGTNIHGQEIIYYDSPQSSLRYLADRNASGRWIVQVNNAFRLASYSSC
ncbi:peptidoglycan-binding domain-containing protein [Streptomyces sp. NPDC004779]